MAMRERKGRASPYQVYWNNPFTGKRESANFATKEEALKHDSLIKHRLKFERESFRKEDEYNGQEEKITLEQAYLLYLREKQFSKQSLSAQLCSMRYILLKLGKFQCTEISTDIIEKIKNEMLVIANKPVTVRNRLAILRTVLNWSTDKGFCQKINFPKMPTAQYEKFIPPTQSELAAMLAVSPPHIMRIILIGSQCGLRVGPCEMFQLKWQDVNLSRLILTVHGSKKK